jgi:hypothetical protein
MGKLDVCCDMLNKIGQLDNRRRIIRGGRNEKLIRLWEVGVLVHGNYGNNTYVRR